MEFRTPVTIDKSPFAIDPCERMLFVGSCFADNIGSRFVDDKFRATVNPFGVMYNPASILHTVERYLAAETAEVARTAPTACTYSTRLARLWTTARNDRSDSSPSAASA